MHYYQTNPYKRAALLMKIILKKKTVKFYDVVVSFNETKICSLATGTDAEAITSTGHRGKHVLLMLVEVAVVNPIDARYHRTSLPVHVCTNNDAHTRAA
jgi:hypothetical protein